MQLLQRKITKSFLKVRIPKECRTILAREIVFLYWEIFKKICLEWSHLADTFLSAEMLWMTFWVPFQHHDYVTQLKRHKVHFLSIVLWMETADCPFFQSGSTFMIPKFIAFVPARKWLINWVTLVSRGYHPDMRMKWLEFEMQLLKNEIF